MHREARKRFAPPRASRIERSTAQPMQPRRRDDIRRKETAMNRPADEARYLENVGLKDFKFGAIGLGTCAGLAILFAILF
jgi:hypothetical protein